LEAFSDVSIIAGVTSQLVARQFMAPADGFVLATATGSCQLPHVAWVWIVDGTGTRTPGDSSNFGVFTDGSPHPASWSVQRMWSVRAGEVLNLNLLGGALNFSANCSGALSVQFSGTQL
jgi:hypothetical protein